MYVILICVGEGEARVYQEADHAPPGTQRVPGSGRTHLDETRINQNCYAWPESAEFLLLSTRMAIFHVKKY